MSNHCIEVTCTHCGTIFCARCYRVYGRDTQIQGTALSQPKHKQPTTCPECGGEKIVIT